MKAGSSSSLSKMIEVVEWSDGGGSGGSGRQAQEVAAADQPSPPSILPSSRPPLPNSSAPSLHKEVPIGYSINVGEIEDDEDLIKVVVAAASGDDQTGDISGDRSSGRPASSVHRFIDSSQVLIQQRHLFDLARRHRNDFISNNNHNNMRPGSQSNFSDMYDVDDDSQYYYHDNKDKLSLKKKSGFWRKIAGYLAQQPLWKLDGARVALPGDFHFPQSPISLPSTGPDQDRDYSSIQQQHSLFLDVVFAIFLNRTTDVLRASPITLSTIGR